jgi:DNA-binding response OmpR family regulator
MPGITGWEVMQRLRVEWPTLSVVVISGASEESGRAATLDAHFIGKPFSSAALLAQVRYLLAGDEA